MDHIAAETANPTKIGSSPNGERESTQAMAEPQPASEEAVAKEESTRRAGQ
jgi:hypothetical protein